MLAVLMPELKSLKPHNKKKQDNESTLASSHKYYEPKFKVLEFQAGEYPILLPCNANNANTVAELKSSTPHKKQQDS